MKLTQAVPLRSVVAVIGLTLPEEAVKVTTTLAARLPPPSSTVAVIRLLLVPSATRLVGSALRFRLTGKPGMKIKVEASAMPLIGS